MPSRLTLLFIAVVPLFLLCSCSDSDDSDHHVSNTNYAASANFYYAFPSAPLSQFRLTAVDGDIAISAEAGLDSVVISGTRRVESESVADADDHLSLLTVEIDTTGVEVSAATHQPQQNEGRRYIVDYSVRLPFEWHVLLSSVNGEVNIDSVSGSVDAALVNGTMNLTNTLGSTNGTIVNGTLNCRTTLTPAGTCQLHTTNGAVNLWIPQTTSAMLSVSVVTGTISMTGLLLYDYHISPVTLSGQLGAGNGHIDLTTVNGPIYITGF